MATTRKLQSTITWCKPYIKNQPLDISNLEPALTIANMVMGTIYSPPFRWRHNRGVDGFDLVMGQCDYVRTLPDFGFLEDQWVGDAAGNVYPITGREALPLAPTKASGRPSELAVQFEDTEAGTITLRTKERANIAYTLGLNYQRAVPQLQSFGDVLTPLPDQYAYVFDWGFLTIASLLVNDARFPIYEKFFVGKLLGLQDGLSAEERNIFLGNWLSTTATVARGQAGVQAGAAGRGQ